MGAGAAPAKTVTTRQTLGAHRVLRVLASVLHLKFATLLGHAQ
jgi:hypothetical protein